MPKTIYPIFKRLHRGQGGFTLIELLIVIAILGVIGAVVALNVGGFFGTGTIQAANTEADNILTAAFAYVADNGLSEWPDTATVNDLAGYLVGTDVKGGYTIDTNTACGFVDPVANGTWPDTITWNGPDDDPPCQWVKAP